MEQIFYMVYMEGAGAPTHKHSNVESAEKEAERLTTIHGKKTYVLRAGICIEPAPKTVKKHLSVTQPEDDLPFDLPF
jgi:hypothetical protein